MNKTLPIDQAETVPMPSDVLPPEPPTPDDGGGDSGGAVPPARRTSFYREAWRRLPRDFGYLALSAVIVVVIYLPFPALFFEGGASHALWSPFALVLLVVALFVARWLGAFEKLRIGWADKRPIRPVDWTPRWQQNWFMRTISAVANPHYWLYLLHAVVVYPAAAFVTLGVGAALLFGFFFPIFAGAVALANGWRVNEILQERSLDQDWAWILGAVGCALSMAIAVVLFPIWSRAATLAHYWIDHGLLGGFKAEVLQQRVVGLQASRAGAVTAEGQALRQIERDLHDGPQQRLVRLRMDLAAAERAMEKDTDKARTLISEASEHAKDALDELRALSRGFAPPILLDRGLVAALEALAARTPIPVGLRIDLPTDFALPTEVERNVYFTVSELLTNTTKHAGASTAGVYMGLIEDMYGQTVLTVSVTDDGRGGATLREGHGIEGLTGRMRALDGELTVSSPVGGPTEATARIPLGALHGVPTGWTTGGNPPTAG
jgi:signal transduction histidine kinase